MKSYAKHTVVNTLKVHN